MIFLLFAMGFGMVGYFLLDLIDDLTEYRPLKGLLCFLVFMVVIIGLYVIDYLQQSIK